jgi:hypothetical protein
MLGVACIAALNGCGGGGGGSSGSTQAASTSAGGSAGAATTSSQTSVTTAPVSASAVSQALSLTAKTSPPSQHSDLCIFGDSVGSSLDRILGRIQTMTVGFVGYALNSQDTASAAASPTDYNGVWHNFEGSGWLISTYDSVTKWVIAVPIIPSSPLVSIAGAAQGLYQSHYSSVAGVLAASGKGDAIIRIGWEFQGDWYPWGYNAQPVAERANYCTNYKAAFRNIVAAFRAKSSNFKFVWNPNLSDQYTMPNVQDCYPGDDVVDSIGLDIYDENYSNIADPAARFQHDVVNVAYGLNWQASFAAAHQKPISFPEWGMGQVGDNPVMMQSMANWFASNQTAFQCYWNGYSNSGYAGNLGAYPKQQAVYAQMFGANAQFAVPSDALFVKAVRFGETSVQADGLPFKSLPLASAAGELTMTSAYENETDQLTLVPAVLSSGLKQLLDGFSTTNAKSLAFSVPLAYTPSVGTDGSEGATGYYAYVYTLEPEAAGARTVDLTLTGTKTVGGKVVASPVAAGTIGHLGIGAWMRYGPYLVSTSDSQDPLAVTLNAVKGDPIVSAIAIFRKGT